MDLELLNFLITDLDFVIDRNSLYVCVCNHVHYIAFIKPKSFLVMTRRLSWTSLDMIPL